MSIANAILDTVTITTDSRLDIIMEIITAGTKMPVEIMMIGVTAAVTEEVGIMTTEVMITEAMAVTAEAEIMMTGVEAMIMEGEEAKDVDVAMEEAGIKILLLAKALVKQGLFYFG
jgi:hypothetical protein